LVWVLVLAISLGKGTASGPFQSDEEGDDASREVLSSGECNASEFNGIEVTLVPVFRRQRCALFLFFFSGLTTFRNLSLFLWKWIGNILKSPSEKWQLHILDKTVGTLSSRLWYAAWEENQKKQWAIIRISDISILLMNTSTYRMRETHFWNNFSLFIGKRPNLQPSLSEEWLQSGAKQPTIFEQKN
jgi:hypothetical protein